MRLPHEDFTFTLLTPCFSGTALGKHDDHAEMRIPPIRGHVRSWHRALFGPANCNRVWGSTNGNEGHGSRVALRLTEGRVVGEHPAPILPHDLRKSGRPRASLQIGGSFTLRLQRLVGCTAEDWDRAQRALRTWLLLGCLGLRSNRAAGSVWPEGHWVPGSPDALKATLEDLGLRDWSVALVGMGAGKNGDELREAASDTLAGHRTVFGDVQPKREPSPTKFKVVRLGGAHCLAAVAPAKRVPIDGSHQFILHHAERLLKSKPRWQALGSWRYLLP